MSFAKNLSQYGNRIALVDAELARKVSYQELSERCDAFARELPSTKSLVALACTQSLETVVSYLTCLREGHGVILYDAGLDSSLIYELLAAYDPDVHCLEGKVALLQSTCLPANRILHPDLALCLSTSGSTGSPKLVRLTLSNIEANTQAIVSYLNISTHDVAISNLPFHYSFGLSILNTHLAVGAHMVLTRESIISKPFWEAFNTYKVTSFSGVPYHFEILERIRFRKMELPALRYITQAGGKLDRSLILAYTQYAEDKKIPFFLMYGQTEASARMAYLPPQYLRSKPEAIGIPIDGGAFSLVNHLGKVIEAPYEIGELVYTGPNVMLGYASSRTDLSVGDELYGVLKTGDLALCDDDGIYYMKGRLKRFIKLYGNRFSLDALEADLRKKHHDCICGGVDNQLMVMTCNSASVSPIQSLLSETYRLHHSLFQVVFRKDFPRSAQGKVQYKCLEELSI